MSAMTYKEPACQQTPACIILLLDHSESMVEYLAGSKRTKREAMATAINRFLFELILRCERADGVRHSCDVGVISYTTDRKETLPISPALGRALAGRELVSTVELYKHPMRVKEKAKMVDDGSGGQVERTVKVPVWYEATADPEMASPPLGAALGYVKGIAETWCALARDELPAGGDPHHRRQADRRPFRGRGACRRGPAAVGDQRRLAAPVQLPPVRAAGLRRLVPGERRRAAGGSLCPSPVPDLQPGARDPPHGGRGLGDHLPAGQPRDGLQRQCRRCGEAHPDRDSAAVMIVRGPRDPRWKSSRIPTIRAPRDEIERYVEREPPHSGPPSHYPRTTPMNRILNHPLVLRAHERARVILSPDRLSRVPKPLLFGAFGAVGCLLAALFLGEPAHYLLWPPPPKEAGPAKVDVLFVLDTTSSMQGAIDGVRHGIIDFAEELSKRKLDARVGLIAYGDEFEGEEPRVLQFGGEPFTSDYAAFRDQVAPLRARGGGDTPESTLDALALAAKQPFRTEATKVLLLITDAPPKVPDRTVRTVAEAGAAVKAAGIDQLHLVCTPGDHVTSYPSLQAAVPGEFFDLMAASRGTDGFSRVLPTIGTRIAEITIRAGLTSHAEVGEKDEGRMVLAISVWTALLAAGIGLALVAGQNLYLNRPWMTRPEATKAGAGSLAAGLAAGWGGQWLALMLYSRWPVLNAMTNTLGWVLLGAVVGPGMSLFVRNLSPRRALIGGALGGFVAALGFAMASAILGEFVGRQIGAALLGFCIGAMVAWVEAAYRRFWLEVTYGPNEVRNVNLGDAPVSIGSNSSVCTVWLPRAAPVDCTFLLRGETLQFTDASGQSTTVGRGLPPQDRQGGGEGPRRRRCRPRAFASASASAREQAERGPGTASNTEARADA